MDINAAVALNMRRIREEKRLTLDAAAAATGVSRSMLAQIEKGVVNPTISVLWKIGNGYRVPFSALIQEKRRAAVVIRAQDTPPMAADGGRYVNHPAFPFDEDRPFETYRIAIAPGGRLHAAGHMAGTEEYITVFAGALRVCAGEAQYFLDSGDSLRFLADVSHSYHNEGAQEALLSMLIYYPRLEV